MSLSAILRKGSPYNMLYICLPVSVFSNDHSLVVCSEFETPTIVGKQSVYLRVIFRDSKSWYEESI